ncbi:uncharacterized protein SCHCODRAFT_02645615 [Schizophyllum commune H4-8]|uniref:uncharacterized protein n=1 Tax=Schizophyllum commune (strain H4-8 / FGSC 9210) TaxID=578458 RepID=UPI00215E378F|nr:uncharacterized protein SCHCODRAFT_02645615 [Schizophyllum commune H4-8]KAI5884861.1 hypothetical protein SCHCODRAFT_02645615 [Schizophyllum commune H4-8]
MSGIWIGWMVWTTSLAQCLRARAFGVRMLSCISCSTWRAGDAPSGRLRYALLVLFVDHRRAPVFGRVLLASLLLVVIAAVLVVCLLLFSMSLRGLSSCCCTL